MLLKGFVKQSVIEQKTTFLSFSFLIDCCMSVFSLFSKNWKDFIGKLLLYIKIEKICKYWQKYFAKNM